jgi:hypothetical protein
MSLLNKLEYHDWYYMMSDDHNVWNRGIEAEEHLRSKIRSLDCPHTMAELRMAVQGMILEDFHEYEEGQYWKVPKQNIIAPCRREDLLTRAEVDDIMTWIKENDGGHKKVIKSAEEI